MTAPLEGRLLNLLVDRMRAIADPSRIRILTLLEKHEACVQELTDELGTCTTNQNISKHLNILYSNGIVSRRREGSRVYYALADYTACLLVRQATASLAGHVEDLVEVVGVEP